jgi:hypothetical protein
MWKGLLIIFVFLVFEMKAQHPGAFTGSSGDGYALSEISGGELQSSRGSNADAYDMLLWQGNNLYTYTGSLGDGYAGITNYSGQIRSYFASTGDGHFMANTTTTLLLSYFASKGDGYHKSQTINTPLLSFTGTHKDGYSKINLLSPPLLATFGSQGDGYDLGMSCRTITWRGLTGTGWNIANNWQDQLIPCHCNPIIVPNQATNFPNVNAGLLRVGGEDDSADFNCKRILVEQGAQLITRVNCFVENLDWIVIRGLMEIRNPTQGALINYGNIDIKGSGTVQFEP